MDAEDWRFWFRPQEADLKAGNKPVFYLKKKEQMVSYQLGFCSPPSLKATVGIKKTLVFFMDR